jgi:hypothetical protein
VRKLEAPDPPSTFRLREINASGLVEIDEDLSFMRVPEMGPSRRLKWH